MSHWHCPPGRKPLTKIPAADLPGMVGKWVSFNGKTPGQRYVLESVQGDTITVSVGAGRGREVLTRNASEACYPRTAELSVSPQTRRSTR